MKKKPYKYFLYNYDSTLGDDFRFSIPVDYARIINSYYPSKHIIMRRESFENKYPCVEAVPDYLFEKSIEKKKDKSDLENLVYTSRIKAASIDSKNRVLIPEEIRNNTGIEKGSKLRIVGNTKSFFIFEKRLWNSIEKQYENK